MKKNLSDYVILSKGVISEKLCNLTIKELEESNSLKQHIFTHYQNNELLEYSRGGDPETGFDKLPTSSDLLMPICWEAIRKYIRDDVGFGWFTTWQGFTGFKHIKYTENTEMHMHCDHLHSLFEGARRGIPILTMLVLLNDNFKGGELVLFDDEVIPMEKGDIVLFPSLFMYPHTVNKITEGTRYSIASWVF